MIANAFTFVVPGISSDVADVKAKAAIRDTIRQLMNRAEAEVKQFNDGLPEYVNKAIADRHAEVAQQAAAIDELKNLG